MNTSSHPLPDGTDTEQVRRHTASTINDEALDTLYDQRDQLLLLVALLTRRTPTKATA